MSQEISNEELVLSLVRIKGTYWGDAPTARKYIAETVKSCGGYSLELVKVLIGHSERSCDLEAVVSKVIDIALTWLHSGKKEFEVSRYFNRRVDVFIGQSIFFSIEFDKQSKTHEYYISYITHTWKKWGARSQKKIETHFLNALKNRFQE